MMEYTPSVTTDKRYLIESGTGCVFEVPEGEETFTHPDAEVTVRHSGSRRLKDIKNSEMGTDRYPFIDCIDTPPANYPEVNGWKLKNIGYKESLTDPHTARWVSETHTVVVDDGTKIQTTQPYVVVLKRRNAPPASDKSRGEALTRTKTLENAVKAAVCFMENTDIQNGQGDEHAYEFFRIGRRTDVAPSDFEQGELVEYRRVDDDIGTMTLKPDTETSLTNQTFIGEVMNVKQNALEVSQCIVQSNLIELVEDPQILGKVI